MSPGNSSASRSKPKTKRLASRRSSPAHPDSHPIEQLGHAFAIASSSRRRRNDGASPRRTGRSESFHRFLAILGLLQKGAGAYSRRFQNYWAADPPEHYRTGVDVQLTQSGKLKFDDAWKMLTAWCYSHHEPGNWSGDIPALVTHWLVDPDHTRSMLNRSVTGRWTKFLTAFTGSAELQIERPDAPLMQPPDRHANTGYQFRFIDLFAGVGGFRVALDAAGGQCVFSSELDEKARESYFRNYGVWPFGDVTQFSGDHSERKIPPFIPRHDWIAAGFPCQPFSQAGRKLGFDDARGTLFFDILKIANARKPEVLFLENVKGLRGHRGGRTFRVICNSLQESGYKVYSKVIGARDFGVPQNRQRIFIVAFRKPIEFSFPEPTHQPESLRVGDILESRPDPRFTISQRMWDGHVARKQRHRERGNGFGYSLFRKTDRYVNTISARYWKDGSEILIDQPRKCTPRTLTPRECARLQGFPEEFRLHTSKRSSYQQFGNSVAVPVIRAITSSIIDAIQADQRIGGKDKLAPVHCD